MRTVHSDCGGEFISMDFAEVLQKNRINFRPRLTTLHPFGAQAYLHIPQQLQNKLNDTVHIVQLGLHTTPLTTKYGSGIHNQILECRIHQASPYNPYKMPADHSGEEVDIDHFLFPQEEPLQTKVNTKTN